MNSKRAWLIVSICFTLAGILVFPALCLPQSIVQDTVAALVPQGQNEIQDQEYICMTSEPLGQKWGRF